MASLCNGLPLVTAHVQLPLSGVWSADVQVDVDAVNRVVGAVAMSLNDGALALLGTTVRAGMFNGRAQARVVGGAHGLVKAVTPRSYRSVPVRTVLRDILDAAGEKLSDTSTAALLGRVLPAWTRVGGTAAQALAVLAAQLDATWRVLPNGTFWFGVETWPAAPLTDYVVLDFKPIEGVMVLGTDSPSLLPGTVLEGQRVDRVVHHVTLDATRTEAWFS